MVSDSNEMTGVKINEMDTSSDLEVERFVALGLPPDDHHTDDREDGQHQ